jgi:hypothetical protein
MKRMGRTQNGCGGNAFLSTTNNKIMRMNAATSTIENGFVHLPEKAAWRGEGLHGVANFPNGRYDDQVDSASQGLDWFKQQFFNGGWFEEMGNVRSLKTKRKIRQGRTQNYKGRSSWIAQSSDPKSS